MTEQCPVWLGQLAPAAGFALALSPDGERLYCPVDGGAVGEFWRDTLTATGFQTPPTGGTVLSIAVDERYSVYYSSLVGDATAVYKTARSTTAGSDPSEAEQSVTEVHTPAWPDGLAYICRAAWNVDTLVLVHSEELTVHDHDLTVYMWADGRSGHATEPVLFAGSEGHTAAASIPVPTPDGAIWFTEAPYGSIAPGTVWRWDLVGAGAPSRVSDVGVEWPFDFETDPPPGPFGSPGTSMLIPRPDGEVWAHFAAAGSPPPGPEYGAMINPDLTVAFEACMDCVTDGPHVGQTYSCWLRPAGVGYDEEANTVVVALFNGIVGALWVIEGCCPSHGDVTTSDSSLRVAVPSGSSTTVVAGPVGGSTRACRSCRGSGLTPTAATARIASPG